MKSTEPPVPSSVTPHTHSYPLNHTGFNGFQSLRMYGVVVNYWGRTQCVSQRLAGIAIAYSSFF